MSVVEKIRGRISEEPIGEPFTVSAFLSFGSRAAVDQAFSRLARSGVIERVSRGIYVRPKVSRLAGKILPSPEMVVKAIAAATGTQVQIHGAEAARRFELTTQAPLRSVFSTTGPSKRLRIGSVEVQLKHTSARKLALAGRPSGDALAALWYVGKRGVTAQTVERIRRRLPPAEFQALVEARWAMPAWMAEAVAGAMRGSSHAGSIPSALERRKG